ncbi:MAG: hypothetical protein O3C42_04445 [Bacteroidetes bacterium]|nr:hypothetical protein [Bacteroidota bacterium]
MKRLRFFLAICVSVIVFSSCEKKQYCASCYESYSGYQATDYCSTSESVDVYIDELYSTPDQDWYCTKSIE